jgi:hypothetical protein
MTHFRNRTGRIAGLFLLVLGLSGCSTLKEKLGYAFETDKYVESVLETAYHGEYEAYLEYTGETQDSARESHASYVEEEVAYFAAYLNLDPLSQQGRARLEALMEDLYGQVRFQVQEPIRSSGYQMVEVVVYPVDFFGAAGAELEETITQFNEALKKGEYASMTEEEQREAYEDKVLSVCEKYREIPESSYSLSVNLTVRELEGGYYEICAGLEELDQAVISY